MAESIQLQSTASEEQVRSAVAAALQAQGGQIEQNEPGTLIVDMGSVGAAFLAGPFRKAEKMPVRITVVTVGGPGGTGIGIECGSHGSGGGYMSGGVFGVVKTNKAVKRWLQTTADAVPQRTDAPAQAQAQSPPMPGETPPAQPGQFTP